MPSKKHHYDLVQNDDYDTRIPLHPDEAFQHGITFNVKYIGILDVPRPINKVDIVAAMRRIRYEFKAKGIKKRKVTMEVSVDGVTVMPRRKRRRKNRLESSPPALLSHPVYRIFYVSHDSQDLKIFSYIARDGNSNVFKCVVFKSSKKSQAMRVVRTIGQAFEVCHKFSINAPEGNHRDHDEQDTLTQDLISDHISDTVSDKPKKDLLSETVSDRNSLPCEENLLEDVNCEEVTKPSKNFNCSETLPSSLTANNTRKTPLVSGETYASPLSDTFVTSVSGSGSGGNTTTFSTGSALVSKHEIQLLKEQLDQQSQQTQSALAQLQLVREQLASEKTARMEAHVRNQQLLVQNQELLDHMAVLVSHLQKVDKSLLLQSHSGPHVAMPQLKQNTTILDTSDHENQTLGYHPEDLIENRTLTNCLPQSPLRSAYPASGSVFNFNNYLTPLEASLEAKLLQRLQVLNCYPSHPCLYQPHVPPNSYAPPLLANPYPLQTPPRKKVSTSSLPTLRSFSTSPVFDRKNDQAPINDYQATQDNPCLQVNEVPLNPQTSTNLQSQQQPSFQKSPSPQKQVSTPPLQNSPFIRPLSQLGTLTTTDAHGRARVIVPVPEQAPDDESGNLLTALRLGNELRPSTITRSTSEKVPHRSELMSQVQRTAWARHTTK